LGKKKEFTASDHAFSEYSKKELASVSNERLWDVDSSVLILVMSGDFMYITQGYVSHLTMETVFMLCALTGGKGWATGVKESMSSEIDEVLKLATSANYLKGKRHNAGWKMKITMLIKQISDARDNKP
jgi:hypothetical protein